MSSLKETIALGITLLLGLAVIAHCTEACKPAAGPVLPAYCYDENAFTGAVLRCTDKSSTRAESQACKRELQVSCGFVETVADGGAS